MKKIRGFLATHMIFMILGLFMYLQSDGTIDRLTVWGYVSLMASALSCVFWTLHIKKQFWHFMNMLIYWINMTSFTKNSYNFRI